MTYETPDAQVLGDAARLTQGGEWTPAVDWLTALRAKPR